MNCRRKCGKTVDLDAGSRSFLVGALALFV